MTGGPGEFVTYPESPSGQVRARAEAESLRIPPQNPKLTPDIVDGLNRLERAQLLDDVASEFGWLTLTEVARLTRAEDPWDIRRVPLDLLGVRVEGAKLCPGFVLIEDGWGSEGYVDQHILAAGRAMSPVMTSWEQVAWFMKPNPGLEHRRPIDISRERLPTAVELEISLH